MSDKLSYTEDELRRLSVTEPNLKRRAQYAQMLKQAQSEMQKAKTKTFAIWVMEGDTPAKQANTFQASGEDEALKQVETYAHANGFTRFVLRALGERWGQYESRDGKNFLRMGYPDRAPSFEAPSGYGTSGKAQGAGVRKAGMRKYDNSIYQDIARWCQNRQNGSKEIGMTNAVSLSRAALYGDKDQTARLLNQIINDTSRWAAQDYLKKEAKELLAGLDQADTAGPIIGDVPIGGPKFRNS